MQFYKYTEKCKWYILPTISVHNYQDQIDLDIIWLKWGVYINLYNK